MELSDFIKETLGSIVNGIIDAQKQLSSTGTVIVPAGLEAMSQDRPVLSRNSREYVSVIEFEVVLTETINKENKQAIGVMLGSFGAGGNRKSGEDKQNVTTIKFDIPLLYPESRHTGRKQEGGPFI